MEQLELSIINHLAETKFSELIYEFQSNCRVLNDTIEQVLKLHDKQSHQLFQKFRLLFEF